MTQRRRRTHIALGSLALFVVGVLSATARPTRVWRQRTVPSLPASRSAVRRPTRLAIKTAMKSCPTTASRYASVRATGWSGVTSP